MHVALGHPDCRCFRDDLCLGQPHTPLVRHRYIPKGGTEEQGDVYCTECVDYVLPFIHVKPTFSPLGADGILDDKTCRCEDTPSLVVLLPEINK